MVMLLALAAHAVDLRVAVQSKVLDVGASTSLELEFTDGDPGGPPELQAGAGLDVGFVNASRSTQIINFSRTDRNSYQYVVTGTQVGTWDLTIPALSTPDGTTSERTLRFEVMAASARDIASDPSEAAVWFDPIEAWAGQVVELHLEARTRRDVIDVSWNNVPGEGLEFVELPSLPAPRSETTNDGSGPVTLVERTVPLVAPEPGTWTVSPSVSIDYRSATRRRSFFSTTRTVRESFAVPGTQLIAKPLPPAPADFDGLVGNFQLEIRTQRRVVPVGEPIELEYRLSGSGVNTSLPVPDPVIEGAQIYAGDKDAKSLWRKQGSPRYVSLVTKSWTIVPTEEGTLTVDPIEVTVFNTSRGTYETLRASMPEIRVVPGDGSPAELETFVPEAPNENAVAENGPTLRTATKNGPLNHQPWPFVWLLAGLAAAVPGLQRLVQQVLAAIETARAARAAPEREATPKERLRSLPHDARARLAELDALLRLALDRDLPDNARAQGEALGTRLHRVRFAGREDDLEAELVAFLNTWSAS